MPSPKRVVVLIWDGLRPDFVRPDLTPNLCRLGDRGVVFSNHHAVFPSETRVNASSVATGCYPGTHGIVGNSLYIPEISEHDTLNTGDHEVLQAIAQHEPLLSKPTLAERLQKAGHSYVIISSGSPGSSWVQCAPGAGALINVRGVIHPESLSSQLQATCDDLFPPASFPSTARNDRLTELIVRKLQSDTHEVIFGWFCDPDFTQHKYGLGEETSLQSIRENDARLQTILQAAEAENADVLVGSDHGFSTLTEPFEHKRELVEAGFDLDDLVWMGAKVAFRPGAADRTEALVAFLQEQDWIGPLFTRGEGVEGHAPGTFSFHTVQLNHPRTPALMFSKKWTDQPNEYGVPGTVFGSSGLASHGTCGPYDMHNVLIGGGPSFKSGLTSEIPSGVVDIAPTVYHLVTGDSLNDVDGRILTEALRSHSNTPNVHTQTLETGTGNHRQFLEIARVDGTEYINSGWASTS